MLAILRPGQRGDGAILAFQLADERTVVGNLHVLRPIHHIYVRHAVLTTDYHDVFGGMARNGRQLAAQQVHIFEECSRCGIRELRRAVAADGNNALAIDAEDSPEYPILMVADFEEFFSAHGIHNAHAVIRTPYRDSRSIRRKRYAEYRVAS